MVSGDGGRLEKLAGAGIDQKRRLSLLAVDEAAFRKEAGRMIMWYQHEWLISCIFSHCRKALRLTE